MMSSHIQQWTLISTVTWEHQLRVTIITETPDIKCCELLRRIKKERRDETGNIIMAVHSSILHLHLEYSGHSFDFLREG